MPPTIRQLEIFTAVARTGSFARAADQLYLSPAAVTLHIQQLERQYGVPLLRRTSRGALLTDEGRILLSAAESIQVVLQNTASVLAARNPVARGALNVGGTEVVGIYVLPVAIAAFRRRLPHVDVNLVEAPTSRIEDALLNDSIELAILTGNITSPELVAEPCGSRPVKLLAHRENPISALDPVPAAMLKSQTLLLRAEPYSTARRLVEEAIAQYGWEFGNIVQIEGAERIIAAVLENRGVGFVQPETFQAALHPGQCVALQVASAPLKIDYWAVHRIGRPLSSVAQEFLSCCREALQPGIAGPPTDAERANPSSSPVPAVRRRRGGSRSRARQP